jgi:hypothetical protein
MAAVGSGEVADWEAEDSVGPEAEDSVGPEAEDSVGSAAEDSVEAWL